MKCNFCIFNKVFFLELLPFTCLLNFLCNLLRLASNYFNLLEFFIVVPSEQVINDFKLRSEREINHYNELLSRVIKKHKTRFGTKEELELLDYSNLLDLYNQDKKSIWNTIKKMLNL